MPAIGGNQLKLSTMITSLISKKKNIICQRRAEGTQASNQNGFSVVIRNIKRECQTDKRIEGRSNEDTVRR